MSEHEGPGGATLIEEKAHQHRIDVERAEGEGMSAPAPIDDRRLGERFRARLEALWERALDSARARPAAALGAVVSVVFLIGFLTGRRRADR